MKSHAARFALRQLQPMLAVLVLLWGGISGTLIAQTNTSKKATPGNRYLLIVETSRPMESRMQGVLETVQDILRKELGKELRTGDSIGTWTYNETLITGKFPLQRWSTNALNTIAGITNFLAHEKYQKQPQLAKVIPALASVVAGSPVLTVILISSGTADISGTPFDGQINATFKQWKDQQQTKCMPYVVLFRAFKGKMTGCAVSPAPWPLELPALPELPKVAVIQTNPAPSPRKAAAVPPLIVSGRKPQPAPTNAIAQSTTTNLDLARSAAQQVSAASDAPKTNAPIASSAAASEPVSAQLASPAPESAPRPGPEQAVTSDATSVVAPPGDSRKPAAKSLSLSTPVAEESNSPTATTTGTLATVADPAPATAATTNAARPVESTLPATSLKIPAAAPFAHSVANLLPFALGAALMAAAIGWFRWYKSRSRVHHPISLITRSLERKS